MSLLKVERPSCWVDLFAMLASVDDWTSLSAGEQLIVAEWAEELAARRDRPTDSGLRPVERRRGAAGSDPELMGWLHHRVLDTIGRQLNGKRAQLPVHELRGAVQLKMVDDHHGVIEAETLRDQALLELVFVLQQKPFPYLRCKECARVVRRGPKLNREFCSAICRTRWHEAHRPPRSPVAMTTRNRRRVKLRPNPRKRTK